MFEQLQQCDYPAILKAYDASTGRWGLVNGTDGWKKLGIDYCVKTDWPAFAVWVCRTFRDNPIQSVQLGEVFISEQHLSFDGHPSPAVPYELTLKDGGVLKGNLYFTYRANSSRWQPTEGIDWHLMAEPIQYEMAERLKSMQNLRLLGQAYMVLGMDNDDDYPKQLEQLRPYIDSDEIFQWLSQNVIYLGAGKTLSEQEDTAREVVAYDKDLFKTDDGTNVLFADGHVEFIKKEILADYIEIAASDRLTLKVVDESGAPVSGAIVGTHVLTRDYGVGLYSKLHLELRGVDSVHLPTTDDNGVVQVSQAEIILDHWKTQPKAALYLIHQERKLGAFVGLYTDHPRDEIQVTLKPLCRVHGTLVNPEFQKQGYPLQWTNVYLGWQKQFVCSHPSENQEIEFWVPPGEYELIAYGRGGKDLETVIASTKEKIWTIDVVPGQGELDLGNVFLPATKLTTLIGSQAPEIGPIKEWANGSAVTLESLKGHPVLLYFDGDSPNTSRDLPELVDLHEQFADQGVIIIAVYNNPSMHNLRQEWKERCDHYGGVSDVPFRIAIDGVQCSTINVSGVSVEVQGATYNTYEVTTIPTTILIDVEGKVVGNLALHQVKPYLEQAYGMSPKVLPDSSADWKQKFDAVYSLDEGENLKRIAPPFIPERKSFYDDEDPDQAQMIPDPPDYFTFHWDGKLKIWGCGFIGGSQSLSSVLRSSLSISADQFEGPSELLGLKMPGDWIVRKGISDAEKLRALETILSEEFDRKIVFENRTVRRPVIVAKGTCQFTPLTGTYDDHWGHFYSDQLDSDEGAGGGTAETVSELIGVLGEQTGLQVIDETKNSSLPIFWPYGHHYSSYLTRIKDPKEKAAKLRQMLDHLEQQTNLTLTVEERKVKKWLVVDRSDGISAITEGFSGSNTAVLSVAAEMDGGRSEKTLQSATPHLQGHVYDSKGQPVAGATVQIRQKREPGMTAIAAPDVVTDAKGYYSCDDIDWPYRLGAFRETILDQGRTHTYQYIGQNRLYEGSRTVDIQFDQEFPKGTCTLRGTVTQPDGTPMTHFTVRVQNAVDWKVESPQKKHEYTLEKQIANDRGEYEIGDLPAGSHQVSIYPATQENGFFPYEQRTVDFDDHERIVADFAIASTEPPAALTQPVTGPVTPEDIARMLQNNTAVLSGLQGTEKESGSVPLTAEEFESGLTQKIAQFDIDHADLQDIIETFGQPLQFVWGEQILDRDNLPDRYVMIYPSGFRIFVLRNKVKEIRFDHHQPTDFLFLGKLKIGSSLQEVLDVLGPPSETIEGSEMGWSGNVLYKDCNGKKGFCYYHRPDKKVRLFFENYKVTALFMTRSDDITNAGADKPEKVQLSPISRINAQGRIEDKIDYPFVNDPQVLGGWESVDYVRKIDQFDPDRKYWKGDLYLKELQFLENGKTNRAFTWTKGLLLHNGDKTASQYLIKKIKGQTYLFMQWKSGDYTIGHMKPSYYVFRRSSNSTAVQSLVSIEAKLLLLPETLAQSLSRDAALGKILPMPSEHPTTPILDDHQRETVLEAVQGANQTRILTLPKAIVADQEAATMQVLTSKRFVNEQGEPETIDVGPQLVVTPHLSSSVIRAEINFTYTYSQDPWGRETTEIATQVAVPDGGTVLLGPVTVAKEDKPSQYLYGLIRVQKVQSAENDSSREVVVYPRNWDNVVEEQSLRSQTNRSGRSNDLRLKTMIDFSPLTPQTTLREAVEFIRHSIQPSIPIVVQWTDLSENAYLEEDAPIGVDGLSVMTLESGLWAIVRSLSGPEQVNFILEDGVITIASQKLLSASPKTVVYDISELITRPGDPDDEGSLRANRLKEEAVELRRTLMQSVASETWAENGGQGRIEMVDEMRLLIWQTSDVHAAIERYLDDLRRMRQMQVAVEARFLMVDDNFLEDIGFDAESKYGPVGTVVEGLASSDAIVAALESKPLESGGLPLDEFQTLDDFQSRFIVRATRAHRNAKTLTAPKVMVYNGESAEVQIYEAMSYRDMDDVPKEVNMGTSLNICPIVQSDGQQIQLAGTIKMSDLLEMRTQSYQGRDVEIPYVQVVNIPFGTVVDDQQSILIQGPPIEFTEKEKKDIPVMGYGQFTTRRTAGEHYLLILIKPTIVEAVQQENPATAGGEPILDAGDRVALSADAA